MEEIELSVMSYTPQRVDKLRSLLAEFEANHHVHVNIRSLTWESSWSEILKFVFQGHGPVVSEVGNTWVTSLAKMNALHPFDDAEVEAMGGAKAFIPATWRYDAAYGDPIWSIPWVAESRVLLYRRDLLQAAGVNEETAFTTHENLIQTLEQLQKSKIGPPLVIPTNRTTNTLHSMPSWIWGAGGDFVDENHRRVAFADPAAKSGIRSFFSLYRFLEPQFHGLSPYQANDIYISGGAAVTIDGPWSVFLPHEHPGPHVLDKIGVALLPGVPCVGASDLVIWKHTPVRHEKVALELVEFLTSQSVQQKCSRHVGLLPARLETLATEPFSVDPSYQVLVKALESGRSLPTIRLWGLIEERLTAAFGSLWEKILADPNPDLDALINAELDPLAQRLNHILQ